MSKFEKLILKLLSGKADNNFNFEDLRRLLFSLGFSERMKGGSHHVFTKENIPDIINIQPIGSKAKDYQVKQVRNLVIKYKLVDYE